MHQRLSKDCKIKSWNITSFGIRGLNDQIKHEQISSKLGQYLWMICCLQETKIKNGCDKNVQDYRLTLSWWRALSCGNQSNDLLCKSMDWFLYDIDLRDDRVNLPSFSQCVLWARLYVTPLHEKCQPGKYGPEKLRIWTLFTQCTIV